MLERIDTLVAFATIMLGISLLITIINQMVASLLGHRATYLMDGLKDLLGTLDPALIPNAEKIAKDVLTHKLASDSIFAHQAWAPLRWKLATTIRPEELVKLLQAVSTGQPYEARVQAILNQANPALGRDAQLIAGSVNPVAPGAAATADELIKQLSDKATKAAGRVEAAFDSTMDRVRQRFTMQMRIWTIVFSLLIAFIYHLDAGRIYVQLSSDPALRASVNAVSEDLMKKYVAVQTPSGQQSGQASGQQSAPQPGQQSQADLEAEEQRLKEAYQGVQSDLTRTNMQLLQVPQPWWPGWQVLGTPEGWGKLFRILATVALLSLGAPFWYNILKNLVNFRSQVAQQQSKEATN
jgi:hypothetical protein